MNSNDSDDDFDDILQSDDEVIPKKTKNIKSNEIAREKEEQIPSIIEANIDSRKSENKSSKTINDRLFDKDIDHFSSTNSGKTKDNSNKPAKSVLESLLNPSKELNDISFLFDKSQSQFDLKTNSIDKSAPTNAFKTEYRPSTGNPKQKESIPNLTNKRTVRFSAETLLDDDINFDSSPSQSRPMTAPNSGPSVELSKSKFVSRFEAAEFDENPITVNSFNTSKSGSDTSLWRDSKPEDVINETGTKPKIETKEITKIKESGRSVPKDTLTDFLQSSQGELFSIGTEKSKVSSFNDIPFANSNRRNSEEDLLDSRRKLDLNEDFTSRRRSSNSQVLTLDRPKTSHSRHDKIQFEMKPDESPQLNFSYVENSDYQLKIKYLESERNELLYKLEQMTKRNSEESEMNEKLFKNRIEILEENMQSKERRLKEEIELLSEQNKQKLQLIEKERLEMRTELIRRQDEIENQKRTEISRLREQHRLELEKVRLDYDNLIEKLKHAKTEEDATIRLAQPTTVQLQSVLTQMSNGAHDLVTMKEQLMEQFNQQIKEKDTQLREKNEYLKQLEEKLKIQKDDNIKDRERLQSLISKLDIQLKEQSRTTEEERWFIRQEQNKLSALQSSLEKEREQILIEKDQNRLSHEEFRKRLLDEQKQMLEQIYDEKRNLADERAKLTREMCKWSETNQISNLKKTQENAELDGIRAALLEERRELERIKAQVMSDREELQIKMSRNDTNSYDIKLKTEKLNNMENELNLKQIHINEKEQHFRDIETKSEEAFRKARELHSKNEDQILKIQKQLKTLNEKEQQINQQMAKMEEMRKNLSNKEMSMVCSKCANSLRKDTFGGSYNNLTKLSTSKFRSSDNNNFMNSGYGSNVVQEVQNSLDYSSLIASQLEEERLIYSIKMAAENDREYLSQERAYLESLVAGSQSSWRTHIES